MYLGLAVVSVWVDSDSVPVLKKTTLEYLQIVE